ncbi:MAG: endonuclease III domain-containing protein [Candidatus Sedimenticola sp. PURPLELP]
MGIPLAAESETLQSIYRILLDNHGHQYWWPGDTPFEIIVGAVLTQNTAWINVEKAIDNLKQEGVLGLNHLLTLEEERLADLIRPSGYFNVKTRRLKSLCRFIQDMGGVEALDVLDTDALRRELLTVNGVGPETADDILLYAYQRPVFVIDAYTRRLFSRLGVISGDESYEELRLAFQGSLGLKVEIFNEYHALIVRHAKYICTKPPTCENCCLSKKCKNYNI